MTSHCDKIEIIPDHFSKPVSVVHYFITMSDTRTFFRFSLGFSHFKVF